MKRLFSYALPVLLAACTFRIDADDSAQGAYKDMEWQRRHGDAGPPDVDAGAPDVDGGGRDDLDAGTGQPPGDGGPCHPGPDVDAGPGPDIDAGTDPCPCRPGDAGTPWPDVDGGTPSPEVDAGPGRR